MDDSPRSTKRRRLNDSNRIVSSPLTKTPARRASGRLTTRSASYNHTTAIPETEEESTPKRRAVASRKTPNGTGKVVNGEDIDVYDDFEGALTAQISSRPIQRLQSFSRETSAATDSTDEITATPRRSRAKAPRSTVKSRKAVADDVEDNEGDVIQVRGRPEADSRNSTPRASARARKPTAKVLDELNGTATNTPSSKGSTRKTISSVRKSILPVNEDTGIDSPSRSSKLRKPAVQRTEIPETEDELEPIPSPSKVSKKSAGRSRRLNRADHIDSHIEVQLSEAEGAPNEDDEDEDMIEVEGSVLDPTEPSPFNKPTPKDGAKVAIPIIYGDIAAGQELELLKTIVMDRIMGRRPSPLVSLDEEYQSVYRLVEHTVTAGEGNSLLVIGARGSGKTALVNKVLSEVSKENGGDYHVVRLNGFIHTDDKIALREIWRQLGKEMDIEDDGSGPGKNYADTLTTLLALLSHPSEQTGEVTDQVAKAVVFIMDEFDLFAQHPRQTLLYNLFDIAQSRKAPIAVLGLTTRIDVTNSLEKRVKSRFSHRYVHLSLAKSFTAFQEICKACLVIQPDQLSVAERGVLEGASKQVGTKRKKTQSEQNTLTEWNAHIESLFSAPSFLSTHLAPTFYRTKSVVEVLTTFLLPTATLHPSAPFTPTYTLSPPDSKLSLIPHLSTLGLSLLIAAARLDIIHDSDTCNFNMAYDEYVTLASKARIQSAAGGLSAASSTSKVWSKDVARREWEGLLELGLVLPVVAGQTGGFGMVRVEVALEEVGEVLKGDRSIDKGLERWCRSI